MPGPVLLLRSPSEDSPAETDKYAAAFRARGYRALSVPVLETVYVHAGELAAVVRARGRIAAPTLPPSSQAHSGSGRGRTGGSERYAGVVVTSGRACEAWRAAVQQLEQDRDADPNPPSTSSWSAIPFYAVGPSTASALSALAHSFPASSSRYVPHDVRGGAEAGTSEKLAHFIIADLARTQREGEVGGEEDHGEEEGQGRKKLLYLTGDKNRDTLPSILAQAGLALDSLQVYATRGSTRFGADLAAALDDVQADSPDTNGDVHSDAHWWIVHFAPSSAKHVLPILRKQFDFARAKEKEKEEEKGDSETVARRRARVAAIGTTTSRFLEEEMQVRVDVVPPKPSADALVEEIARWDREHGPGL